MFRKVKALFDLGRISNLPTIWSNCLAAWVLAGAGFSLSESMHFKELEGIFGWLAHAARLPLLFIPAAAASFLYMGGTALNDVFDADYDREHRPERPIPSGVFTLAQVWGFAVCALLVGGGIFLYIGMSTADGVVIAMAVGLVGLIVLYDWIHKRSVWASVPMGACRFVLYVLVAFAATHVTHIFAVSKPQRFDEMTMESLENPGLSAVQLTGVLAIAVALFAYIVALTLSARAESGEESVQGTRKTSLLLYLPVVACIGVLVLNKASIEQYLGALIVGTIFIVWTKSAIRLLYDTTRERSRIGIAVGRLLAGICLVDGMVAAAAAPSHVPALVCVGLFFIALFLQRSVPGT